MTVKTRAFILSVIKYNDYDAVVKAYAEKTGFTTYFIKGLFKGKSGKLKLAFFQPAGILDLVTSHKNKGQLEYVKDAQVAYHYKNLHADFDKLNISVFLREVLLESIKNEQPDADLFQFIMQSFIDLDQSDYNPDFHLTFMLSLSRFLGFYPSINDGKYFDMLNANFDNFINSGNFLNLQESSLLKDFLGTIFASKSHIKCSQYERQKLLQILLDYFSLHINAFKLPKSIKILGQLYK